MRLYEFASMGATSSGGIATVAASQNKNPIRRQGKVTEMFDEGAAGVKFFDVNDIVFDSLMGWFEDEKTSFDNHDQTATVYFKGGITPEISQKIDRFNSNWMTKSMALDN